MRTRRQTEFIKHYIATKNGAEAARLAGYSHKKARITGHRLYTDKNIRAEIDAGLEKVRQEFNINGSNWLEKTFKLHTECTQPSVKARYWEMILKGQKILSDQSIQNVSVLQLAQDKGKVEQSITPKRLSSKDLEEQPKLT